MSFLRRFNFSVLAQKYRLTHFINASGERFDAEPLLLEREFEKVLTTTKNSGGEESDFFLNNEEIKKTLLVKRSLVLLQNPLTTDAQWESCPASEKGKEDEPLAVLQSWSPLHAFANNALIIISHCACYLRSAEERITAPEPCSNFSQIEKTFLERLESYHQTHEVYSSSEDDGYIILWPKHWGQCDMETNILAGDLTHRAVLSTGVPGTTCMSINRRLMDARFSTRWLVGDGLDIGGGNDSIGVYKSLFPAIKTVTIFDIEQGDAQYLARVPDNEFDFVYSAHCLEHVMDPYIALPNWLRVVKPNGYLVLTLPDEDLYEQGVWPSTFNHDHKHTFTPFKHQSWSPVSVNVLALLQTLPGRFNIEKIERLNHSYFPTTDRFDQTRTAFAESAIEIIIQKIS